MGKDYASPSLSAPPRRSITLPLRSSDPADSRQGHHSSNSDPKVENLFACPSVRIVCFSAGSASESKDPFRENNEVGVLPWSSALERVIAVGPLRIYRAPGSVAFLNCGNVIQAIFPKSKCWCVDDASTKFVLQIRRPQYWRIELSNSNQGQDGLHISAELKQILSQILQFEKTACPFQRTFTVELPELSTTPIKKKPWKPGAIPKTDSTCNGSMLDIGTEKMYITATLADSQLCQETDRNNESTDDTDLTPLANSKYTYPDAFTSENIAAPVQTPHSSTNPSQLTIITSSPTKALRAQSPVRRSNTPDSKSSDISSIDSFHTVESWHSPISPLPLTPSKSNPALLATYPYPHDNIFLTKGPHKHGTSETTATPETPRTWEVSRAYNALSLADDADEYTFSPPRTPALMDDVGDDLDEEHFEIVTPPTNTKSFRHRLTTRAHSSCARHSLATTSPLSTTSDIPSPSLQRSKRLRATRNLPTAIIRKTCEILLSPPSHLIHLMLDIASKIAAGEWRGIIFGLGEQGEKIIGQWDYEDHKIEEDEWGEDDYGISLGGAQVMRERSKATSSFVGSSWEID